MRKICFVITARPSYSRVRSALCSLRKLVNVDLQIILTASALLDRYGNVAHEVESDGFYISSRVFTVLEGESPVTMAKTTGIGIIELTSEFQRLKPDLVVTIADRFETLATAISTTYLGIPLVHLQGGEITGSLDERVRHAVTKLSDFHLACTPQAALNIIRMGEHPTRVFNVGCPSIDVAASIHKSDSLSFDPFSDYCGVGNPFSLDNDFVVALLHPVTSEFSDSEDQANLLLETLKNANINVFWFWPNVDAGSDGTSRALRRFRELNAKLPFFFFKNISPEHFLELLTFSRCIIGNSSVGIRECSFLGVPCVNIGTRQDGRERSSNVIDCDWDANSILAALRISSLPVYRKSSTLYGSGNSGETIAEILASLPLSRAPLSKRLNY
jgi:UDP-hydrolysing UDP-N-acetyl-D-glucosamine 2-epimerase